MPASSRWDSVLRGETPESVRVHLCHSIRVRVRQGTSSRAMPDVTSRVLPNRHMAAAFASVPRKRCLAQASRFSRCTISLKLSLCQNSELDERDSQEEMTRLTQRPPTCFSGIMHASRPFLSDLELARQSRADWCRKTCDDSVTLDRRQRRSLPADRATNYLG